MYYPVELRLSNYKPLLLEEGMLIPSIKYLEDEDSYIELWEVTEEMVRRYSPEEFFSEFGYPVELSLLDDYDHVIAEHDQIAWWDNDTDKLEYLTLKYINNILREDEGYVEVDVDSFYVTADILEPKLFEDKVILRRFREIE